MDPYSFPSGCTGAKLGPAAQTPEGSQCPPPSHRTPRERLCMSEWGREGTLRSLPPCSPALQQPRASRTHRQVADPTGPGSNPGCPRDFQEATPFLQFSRSPSTNCIQTTSTGRGDGGPAQGEWKNPIHVHCGMQPWEQGPAWAPVAPGGSQGGCKADPKRLRAQAPWLPQAAGSVPSSLRGGQRAQGTWR